MKMTSVSIQGEPAVLTVTSVARTHIGTVRAVNEDRLLDFPDRGLWAVADGMGGHSLGDEAATIVVRALGSLAAGPETIDRQAIDGALSTANALIFAASQQAGQTQGSTVAGLLIAGTQCTVFWAGDSRVYRLRAGYLKRLTGDHRLVQEMVDAGALDERQAREHPQSSVITRALGVAATVSVEYVAPLTEVGDLYLICTDGLSDMLDDGEIYGALSSTLATSADLLVQAALRAGGTDNVSVVVISVES